MAKSARARTAGDAMIKASARRLGVAKRTMKKAVQEASVRLVAERIAREELDSKWQEIADQARQQPHKLKAETAKA